MRKRNKRIYALAALALSLCVSSRGWARPVGQPQLPSPENIIATAACGTEGMPEQMYRAYVTGTQEELQTHGYNPGHSAGVLDARTQAAIRQYQRDARLPVNGCVSKELLDHLKFHTPKVYARGTSAQSSLILAIQQELAKRGYRVGSVDGKAGPRTRSAIQQFQRDAGLFPSGTADQSLLDKLRTGDPSIRAH